MRHAFIERTCAPSHIEVDRQIQIGRDRDHTRGLN